MKEIVVGDLVRVDGAFAINDADTDPTTVSCWYQKPDGAITHLVYGTHSELVKQSTGKYYVDITVSLPGSYIVNWEGTGSVRASRSTSFGVING